MCQTIHSTALCCGPKYDRSGHSPNTHVYYAKLWYLKVLTLIVNGTKYAIVITMLLNIVFYFMVLFPRFIINV